MGSGQIIGAGGGWRRDCIGCVGAGLQSSTTWHRIGSSRLLWHLLDSPGCLTSLKNGEVGPWLHEGWLRNRLMTLSTVLQNPLSGTISPHSNAVHRGFSRQRWCYRHHRRSRRAGSRPVTAVILEQACREGRCHRFAGLTTRGFPPWGLRRAR